MFIDQIHIVVQAGDGGKGSDSHYIRTDHKMLAIGGDGGKGGDVIIRADKDAPPLGSLRQKQLWVAESGGNGGRSRKTGKSGSNLVILVPPGTRIYDRKRALLIRELMNSGDAVIVLKGGTCGIGNSHGGEVKAPQKGEAMELELTMRIMADVFLVGLPDSGKSKLMNALTRLRLKECAYPFSTTVPEIGMCLVNEYRQLSLCELPSIYHHSHEGHGVGNDFLKHLEHAKLILFVVDPVSKFAGSLKEGLDVLRRQIEIYNKKFLETPYAIVINKMDLEEAKLKVKEEKFKKTVPTFPVSALTGDGIPKLKQFLDKTIRI